ncbi:MAG: aquaporin [Phycisphaerales bacterium]
MSKLLPACVAEFIGTFILCFFGIASIVLTAKSGLTGGEGSLVTVALAHGIALAVCVSGCMYISGGQFNPAVSLGLVIAGKQSIGKALLFSTVQLIAAACGAGMVQLLLTPTIANASGVDLGATIGSLTRNGMDGPVIGVEGVLTFLLMFVILTTTVDDRGHKLGGFPIGLTVAACILAAGPLTGASMNPARSFGPAICGNHWGMFYAYVVGPVLGAALAALVYRLFWQRPQQA